MVVYIPPSFNTHHLPPDSVPTSPSSGLGHAQEQRWHQSGGLPIRTSCSPRCRGAFPPSPRFSSQSHTSSPSSSPSADTRGLSFPAGGLVSCLRSHIPPVALTTDLRSILHIISHRPHGHPSLLHLPLRPRRHRLAHRPVPRRRANLELGIPYLPQVCRQLPAPRGSRLVRRVIAALQPGLSVDLDGRGSRLDFGSVGRQGAAEREAHLLYVPLPGVRNGPGPTAHIPRR